MAREVTMVAGQLGMGRVAWAGGGGVPVEREASIVLVVLFFPVSSTSMVFSVGSIIIGGGKW